MNTGENIQKIRELNNITVQEMAEVLLIEVKDYQSIENDEVDLTISQLEAISARINCRLVDFFLDVATVHIHSHFYNHENSQCVNIIYLGFSETKNLEEQLKESKQKLQTLKVNIKTKNN